MQTVSLEENGKVSAIVFEIWQKVWSYFEDENEAARRAYSVDFEFYAGGGRYRDLYLFERVATINILYLRSLILYLLILILM